MTQSVVAPRARVARPHTAHPRPSASRSARAAQPAPRAAARAHRGRVGAFVVLATIFALVSAVVFHVVLAQGQLTLDRFDREIDTARRDYEERRLEVSTLASPERIVSQAEALGLEMPQDPATYLTLPGAPPPTAVGGETATTLDDWKKVKQQLGDEP